MEIERERERERETETARRKLHLNPHSLNHKHLEAAERASEWTNERTLSAVPSTHLLGSTFGSGWSKSKSKPERRLKWDRSSGTSSEWGRHLTCCCLYCFSLSFSASAAHFGNLLVMCSKGCFILYIGRSFSASTSFAEQLSFLSS